MIFAALTSSSSAGSLRTRRYAYIQSCRLPSSTFGPSVLPKRRHSSQATRVDSISNSPTHPADSYVIGPTQSALFQHTLSHHWSTRILTAYHSHPALVSKAEPSSPIHQHDRNDCLRLTYSQLDQRATSLAIGLYQLGIRKGDRVGICTQNHSIYPILQWATAKLGAILTTINPSYSPSELVNVLKKVDCHVLFSTPSIRSKDMVPIISTLTAQIPSLTHVVLVDNESYRPGRRSKANIFKHFDAPDSSVIDLDELMVETDQTKSTGFLEEQLKLDANDVINLQFTSGTTGLPKAVSLTHRNLLNNAHQIADRMRLSSDDRLCNAPPMFHCLGLVCGNMVGFVKGATVVIPSEGFEAEAVLQTISEERCTALNGVGTMFLAEICIAERTKKYDLSSLRTGVVAGAPVSAELMGLIESRLGIKELTILYGMTETSPGSFQTQPSDDYQKRTKTVGSILPHLRAKVVDLDTREVVKRGVKGELWVSGYAVQKGYWADAAETSKAMVKDAEGRVWMKSGDLAVMDHDGYLQIVGRAKDVIIRGGENLFPVAIENCISGVDGVIDVAVVGIADNFYGEVVGVFIKRKTGASETSGPTSSSITTEAVCQAVKKDMSPSNTPKYVWFLDLIGKSDFPTTASGKIKKNELKAWANEQLNQSK